MLNFAPSVGHISSLFALEQKAQYIGTNYDAVESILAQASPHPQVVLVGLRGDFQRPIRQTWADAMEQRNPWICSRHGHPAEQTHKSSDKRASWGRLTWYVELAPQQASGLRIRRSRALL